MFLTDVVVVLAILLFFLAVAIELKKDRNKKMYVGREAKSQSSSVHVPAIKPEAGPPVVTQDELKQPKRSA